MTHLVRDEGIVPSLPRTVTAFITTPLGGGGR